MIECNDQKVDSLISEDRRVMAREIAVQLGIGHHAVQEMIATLGFRKFVLVGFLFRLWGNRKMHTWMCHHSCVNNMLS